MSSSKQYDDIKLSINLTDFEDQNLLLRNLMNEETARNYEIDANLETATLQDFDIAYTVEVAQDFSESTNYSLTDSEEVDKGIENAEANYLAALDSLRVVKGAGNESNVIAPPVDDISLVIKKLQMNKGAGRNNVATKKLYSAEEGLSENDIQKIDKKESRTVVSNPWKVTKDDKVMNVTEKLILSSAETVSNFSTDYKDAFVSEKSLQEKLDYIDGTMSADNFVEWDQRFNKKIDAINNTISQGVDTVTDSLAVAESVARFSQKVGFFPQTFGAIGDVTNAVKGGLKEVSQTLNMDTNQLAMKRFEMGKQQRALVGPGYSYNDVIYPEFANTQIQDILTEMDAFTNKFICFFTLSRVDDSKIEVLKSLKLKLKVSKGKDYEYDYPYFYYIDDINIKPVKKSVTELKYGAFKTSAAMLKPEGKNEFEFTVANDISLIFWQQVRSFGLGIGDAVTYTTYATEFGGLRDATNNISLEILIPKRFQVDDTYPVFNRIRLEGIRFASVQDLPFSHKEGQLKSKIKGICKRILWAPNSIVNEKEDEKKELQ